jgi:hypothetical protein
LQTLNAIAKKLYIFKHFAKSKKVFLPISIILRLIPIDIPKKYKIETPSVLLPPLLEAGHEFQEIIAVSVLKVL